MTEKMWSDEQEKLPWLHLYPQWVWHCEARIIGNDVALRALAAALLEAADKGAAKCEAFVIDGEGYAIEIERTNTTGLGYTRMPYKDEMASRNEGDYAAGLRARIAELEKEVEGLAEEAAGASL